ncbi:MAG: peptidoglycan DD-metalloendopeptidase family protein [Anaerolineae bacterium]
MQNSPAKQSVRLLTPDAAKKLIPAIHVDPARLKDLLGKSNAGQRLATHLIIIALVLGIVFAGGVKLTRRQLHAPVYTPLQPPADIQDTSDTGRPLTLPGVLKNRNRGLLLPAPVPHTIIPNRIVEVEEIRAYKVQPGDTIYAIAAQFSLAPETVLWANPSLEDNPDLLLVGQQITILPVDGVYHQVGSADTLEEIAATFKVQPQTIVDYHLNNLDPENPTLTAGQWLVIPGGVKPYVPKYVSVASVTAPGDALAGTGTFRWPTSGSITQEFWAGHRALDIGAWTGAPIFAADSGYVVAAQWDDTGYGRMIVIDHGNGFNTLYAHLSVMYVSVGDEVTQGQQIAEMGSTGNSTGPHLHFEVILNGVKRNPWGFLP